MQFDEIKKREREKEFGGECESRFDEKNERIKRQEEEAS